MVDGARIAVLRNPQQVESLVAAVFRAAGSNDEEARTIAEHLVDSNLVGHDSHGIVRVHKYVEWASRGLVVPNRHAQIVRDSGAAVLVDGEFGYGQVIGREAVDMMIDRVGELGSVSLAVRNSGHLGRIGAWAERLAQAGIVSVHFVNTSGFGILVAPHGGSDRRMSANPIAAGTPRIDGPPIVLDMAASIIAEGKIQMARNKREPLPANSVIDGTGAPTTDANLFYADPPGAILPVGAHKGSGLSFFCEVLAGSLTGGFASNPGNPTSHRLVNNMLSIAFDPSVFEGSDFFAKDVHRLAEWVCGSPPMDVDGSVLLPGEVEWQTRELRKREGIPVDSVTWSQLAATATRLGVPASDCAR